MAILIQNKQPISIEANSIQSDTEKILRHLGYADFDLGILLCDSKTMQEYNRTYRDKDKPTDILSFPFYPNLKPGQQIKTSNGDEKNLGDLILCPEYIKNDLERWGQSFDHRMQVLLVHGICHLLGYDHIKDDDYAIMKKQEEDLIKLIN